MILNGNRFIFMIFLMYFIKNILINVLNFNNQKKISRQELKKLKQSLVKNHKIL